MMHSKLSYAYPVTLLIVLFLMQIHPQFRGDAREPELQSLAQRRDFYIGAAVDMEAYRSDSEYQAILKREFNVCVAENAFKFSSIHPKKGVYQFDDSDLLADFAQDNGLKLRGHTLVWHKQLPQWVTEGQFSREEAVALMKDHINTVVTRYQGKIWAWDVVNEAVDDDGKGLRKDSFWQKTIGPDYVKLAFQFAREADPGALLYYNDFSAEDLGSKSKAVYQLVRDLKQQGIQVDGVGWQMHIDTNFKTKPSYRENAKRLADLGLELSITELDVKITLPTTQEELRKQADVYREVAQFCLTTPNCKALVMWGFTDKYSWIPQVSPGSGDALVFDADYQPKPAYLSLKQAMQDATSSIPTITKASMVDDNLVIAGTNFSKDSIIFVNWKQFKSAADKQNPLTSLLIKKARKSIGAAQKIILQVQNPGGKLSPEYTLVPE
jgi:endo-1,4-beta-xylanase